MIENQSLNNIYNSNIHAWKWLTKTRHHNETSININLRKLRDIHKILNNEKCFFCNYNFCITQHKYKKLTQQLIWNDGTLLPSLLQIVENSNRIYIVFKRCMRICWSRTLEYRLIVTSFPPLPWLLIFELFFLPVLLF